MPPPTSEASSLPQGDVFGKYVLLKRLAMGGMAEVYLANARGAAGFTKLVVIKMVLPHLTEDPKFTDMFLDEGLLAARLSHPNIAQTFDLGEVDGRYFIAMEFVPGETLGEILLGDRCHTERRVRAIGTRLVASQYRQ